MSFDRRIRCNQAWLLKNSLAELPPKMCRVRMPYKRSSPISDTFLVTPFGLVFRQIEFFNSHRRLHQLHSPGPPEPGQMSVIAIFRQLSAKGCSLYGTIEDNEGHDAN